MGRFDSGPPLMNTNQIRAELEGIAKIVQGLEAELAVGRKDRVKLVDAAKAAGLPMTEVARLAGVSRVAAYEMLKG